MSVPVNNACEASPVGAIGPRSRFRKVVLLTYVHSDFEAQISAHLADVTETFSSVTEGDASIVRELTDADCLLVEPGIRVDSSILNAAPGLRLLGVYGTDCSPINLEHAARRGVVVCNTPGYSTNAVAEFVFGAIFEHVRTLAPAQARTRAGRYTEQGAPGTEIRGKTFGIVGLGRIGRQVADIAQLGFGAQVRYWSRNRKAVAESAGIAYANLEVVLRESDFVSVHVANTPDTHELIGAQRMDQIKPGAVVVHLSPVELLDLQALERRLRRRDLTFILDHTDELPPAWVDRLMRFDNCVLYPAIACTTNEAKRSKRAILLEAIDRFLAGDPKNRIV